MEIPITSLKNTVAASCVCEMLKIVLDYDRTQ